MDLGKQERFKSKAMWASILGMLVLLIGNLGLYDVIGIDENALKNIIDIILSILVTFGILNNPTDSENF